MTEEDVYIIIPAKDEDTRIGQVVDSILDLGYSNVIVVDDGSSDQTRSTVQLKGVTVVSHAVNLGVGAATKTGIEVALEKGAQYLVTMDGDGQHFADDIPALVSTLVSAHVDCVLGSRFKMKGHAIPKARIFMNQIGNIITALITGLWVSDSQSGMKAFTADFGRKLDFQFSGYEFCTEFIHFLRQHKASFKEVPIKVHYSSETMKKGQSFKNGFRMLIKFIRGFG
ncbi:MAG: glycosyltransferase family 2 protein [Saprospiraceae bacterium]|nr:glycosyltransferase family 2 protein [Saprospiraceae bacterium]